MADVEIRARERRLVKPRDTLRSVLRHAAAFGLTRVANITGLDTIGIPVWTACRPNSRSLSVSQGKGLDDDAAKISAVMEAIEAFHAERVSQPVLLASYDEMRGVRAVVEPDTLCRTTRPFDPRSPIFWIEATDLVTQNRAWIPFEVVHLNFTHPPLPGSGLFVATSNGLASGNTRLEALSHGLCELIERDAATLWANSGARQLATTRVDLSTVDDPEARSLLEKYERAEIGVAVWDMTSDVRIPAFTCSIADRNDNRQRPLTVARGMGCHPLKEIALVRALTEAAQSRLTVIAGSRDDLGDSRYAVNESFQERERLRALVRDGVGKVNFRSLSTCSTDSVDGDVEIALERLATSGLTRFLSVDLTRPEFQVPVFRVVVPGLEALYDTPGYSPGVRASRHRAGSKSGDLE